MPKQPYYVIITNNFRNFKLAPFVVFQVCFTSNPFYVTHSVL